MLKENAAIVDSQARLVAIVLRVHLKAMCMEFFSSLLIINFFKVRNWQVNDCKKVFCNSNTLFLK